MKAEEIEIKVTTNVDEEIKKAKELVSLLERANELIQSLGEKSTRQLVNELSKRLAVKEIIVEPYERFEILTNVKQDLPITIGPARILVVYD